MLCTAQYFAAIAWDSTPRPASLRKPQPISKKILNKVILDAVAKCLQARPVGTTPIVAWHEVLGKRPSKEPSRRVRYDRAQLIPEVFLVEMCAVFLKEG